MKKKQERREEEGTRMPPPKGALTKSEATSLGHLVMDSALGDGGVASYQFPCTSIREWGIVVCATECDDDDTSGVHIPPPDPLATQSHSAMRKKEPRMAEFIFFGITPGAVALVLGTCPCQWHTVSDGAGVGWVRGRGGERNCYFFFRPLK